MKIACNKNEKLENMLKQKSGITLIALVVTIVVLLILAGITISLVFGQNGIVKKAQEAKNVTEQATLEEQQNLNILFNEMTNIIEGTKGPMDPTEQTAVTIEEITKGEIFEETTKVTDESKDIFYVPEGFAIAADSPSKIDEGIVITNENDTKQFVWIPVDSVNINEMYQNTTGVQLTGVKTTTNLYSKLDIRSEDATNYVAGLPNTTNAREPDLLAEYDIDEQYYKDILGYDSVEKMANALVREYIAIYNSIKKYSGFYVGRYELTGTLDNPTTQKGAQVLSASGSLAKNWYNLKKACSNVMSTDKVQTAMIYGYQWDTIMKWLVSTGDKTEKQVNEDSTEWGNYKDSINDAMTNSGSKQNSGSNEAWKANNIYDLAGNYLEWTQEAYDTNKRVSRGGDSNVSGIDYTASDRDSYYPYYSYSRYSTRVVLYMK